MNIYFIKEKGKHGNKACIQGFFVAPNETYLFEMIDQKVDPYEFVFTKVNNNFFGAYFTGFDHASEGHRIVEDTPINEEEINIDYIESISEVEFDTDETPSFSLEASELKWKTWTSLSLGKKTHYVDQFGESK